LITGAEGFVGSQLVAYLQQRAYTVIAGVRNRARKLAYERNGTKALVCDVSDSINVARVVASVRPDGIAHLAGPSRPNLANDEPLLAYQSTVTAWANILDAVRRITPRARVLLVSSSDVYGQAGTDGAPLSESTPRQPATTFGALKAAAEDIAHTFFESYHLNLTIARPFQILGPGQSATAFYPALARRLADPELNGNSWAVPNLQVRRDVLHVQDAVAAFERLLAEGQPNQVYNVCSGQAPTCQQVLDIMIRQAARPIDVTDAGDGENPEPVPVLVGDNGRIRSELGWAPARSWEDAARELVLAAQPRSDAVPANL